MNWEVEKQTRWEAEKHFQLYTVDRPLVGALIEQPYNVLFAHPQIGNLTQVIETKIQDSLEALRIYDVGCGKGRFLQDCAKHWGTSVRCEGSTAYPYHLQDDGNRRELEDLGISIRTENVEDLRRIHEFDVVTAVYVLNYTFDPFLALQNIYRSLRIDGIGCVTPLSIFLPNEDEEELFHSLLKSQYDFLFLEPQTVLFSKRSEELEIPLTKSGTRQSQHVFDVSQATYSLQ